MPLDAAHAERWGLVNRSTTGDAGSAVDELADAITSRAPIAQRAVKRTIQATLPPAAPFFDAPHAAFQITTADSREGRTAFANPDRTPEFRGK
jgi:enoyl-CoA hydratase/carnithine racemase